jgi:transcriptional regulator with XRE-family HTH domain
MAIEDLVRARLRSTRLSLGWSLDELAARTNVSASTLSRVETGKRTISLDLLVPLCQAMQTDINALLDTDSETDVVIRPVAATYDHGMTIWPLTRHRDATGIVALKVRLEPTARHEPSEVPGVHPGHDWFFVLSGVVKLTLGDSEILVHEGEAAEFSTMTPHRFAAHGGPAELLMIFDRDGQRAHMHAVEPAGTTPART